MNNTLIIMVTVPKKTHTNFIKKILLYNTTL